MVAFEVATTHCFEASFEPINAQGGSSAWANAEQPIRCKSCEQHDLRFDFYGFHRGRCAPAPAPSPSKSHRWRDTFGRWSVLESESESRANSILVESESESESGSSLGSGLGSGVGSPPLSAVVGRCRTSSDKLGRNAPPAVEPADLPRMAAISGRFAQLSAFAWIRSRCNCATRSVARCRRSAMPEPSISIRSVKSA